MEPFKGPKLEFFFYQTLCIMEYLHQRGVYYGDMKPANILVFKDYRVKVGDLGISIKLNSQIPENKKHYKLLGITKGFVSD